MTRSYVVATIQQDDILTAMQVDLSVNMSVPGGKFCCFS
jgi:hypothetical protein